MLHTITMYVQAEEEAAAAREQAAQAAAAAPAPTSQPQPARAQRTLPRPIAPEVPHLAAVLGRCLEPALARASEEASAPTQPQVLADLPLKPLIPSST